MIHKSRKSIGSKFIDEDGDIWFLSENTIFNDVVVESWVRLQSEEEYTRLMDKTYANWKGDVILSSTTLIPV